MTQKKKALAVTKKKKPRIPYYAKPANMTLEQWQIALRRQAAQDSRFGISAVNDEEEPGVYQVESFYNRQRYKVVYRGSGSSWNYCSCMDFKTSQLGTCKHIEAVKLWLADGPYQVHKEIPPYTSVYVDYVHGRNVKIRIGQDHHQEFEALASKYFRKDGSLSVHGFQSFPAFLKCARSIDHTFRCYQDALDLVLDCREAHYRKSILQRYTDADLDHLLNTTLYPYQKQGVKFAFEKGNSIIADEMGLGKTIQAIATAELLIKERLIESVLILCPTSLKYQWKSEIERFASHQVIVIEGDPTKRFEQYNALPTYKIVSYNSASNDVRIHGSLSTDLLIMDEVQRLKNWSTQIARSARKIESRYRVILSGTPLENKLEELYSVMELADQHLLAPFYKFRDQCEIQSASGRIIGYRNLNKVGDLVKERLIRRRKRDVALQMPKRRDQNIFVPMTHQQMDCHDEYKSIVARLIQKWNRLHFLSEQDRKRLLLNLSKMRMVSDSTFILDQNESQHYDTKIQEVMNIVDSLMSQEGEKVVIFSQWERMTRLVSHELDRRGITYEYLHGSVPSRNRRDLVSNFSSKPQSRVFLTTDAGATGLNLQAAATIVNLDLPWNPAVLEQRIARIYRLGQKNNVQVINLISKDTIEEQMLSKLHFKTSMFQGVLDDGEDEIFLDQNGKFAKMIDGLSQMIDQDQTKKETIEQSDQEQEKAVHEPEANPDPIADDDGTAPEPATTDEQQPQNTTTPPAQPGSPAAQPASNPNELVAQGVSFFKGLTETLKSPQATEQLVDALVKKDENTGATTISIPVPDKDSVRNLFLLLGKLLT